MRECDNAAELELAEAEIDKLHTRLGEYHDRFEAIKVLSERMLDIVIPLMPDPQKAELETLKAEMRARYEEAGHG